MISKVSQRERQLLNTLCGGWGEPRLAAGDPGFVDDKLRREVGEIFLSNSDDAALFQKFCELRARFRKLTQEAPTNE